VSTEEGYTESGTSPPKERCVYLWWRGDDVLYVGMSVGGKQRARGIAAHRVSQPLPENLLPTDRIEILPRPDRHDGGTTPGRARVDRVALAGLERLQAPAQSTRSGDGRSVR